MPQTPAPPLAAAPAPAASRDGVGVAVTLTLAVLGLAALSLLGALAWAARPAPEAPPAVAEVLDRAAGRGILAFDAPTGLSSLPAREMPEGSYRLWVTARDPRARPDTVISVEGRDACVAMGRELARMHGAIGFCQPRP